MKDESNSAFILQLSSLVLSVFSVPLWFNRFLPVTHGYKALPRTTGRGRQHDHVKHL